MNIIDSHSPDELSWAWKDAAVCEALRVQPINIKGFDQNAFTAVMVACLAAM